MVSPFSLSCSPHGKKSFLRVCMQCFGLLCWFDIFIFFLILNFIMCLLLCIYNKEIHGLISLNFWLCYLHITKHNLHSLPYLFLSVHATFLLFHTPKGHTASWCKVQKRSTKSDKMSGRVEERSHKLWRPWLQAAERSCVL